ncbi:MAG: adenylate/guanylate cyclase domain-containing protein [Chitinophagaceae bacterium]|nr:adenylate/guanylate cyclase domain-containing protein [Chitinophagaceae bacterium]
MFKYAKLYARREDDLPDVAFQKRLLVIICSFLFLCGVAWWLMWYLIFGWSIPTTAAGLFGVWMLIMIVVSHKLKNHMLLVHATFLGTMIVPVVCQWSLGNMHNSGMIIAWSFLTPLGILIFSSLRPAIIYMAIFVTCIMITVLFEPVLGRPLVATEGIIQLFYSMNLITSFSVIFATSAWFVNTIKKEKLVSETLLLNILPTDVAEELKKFGKVEPVAHEKVTVLFTDFKGFTEQSEAITAKELVEEINTCFAAFDEIVTRYNIEKIKTIGDSYMAVGGNFSGVDCTPWHVISAGLEMQEYIHQRKKERDQLGEFSFEMRVGVHCGSIVSGVVGVKKFQFDIWGDTVNIASRMQSHGEVGEVNITGSAFELVKDKFDGEYRGKLPVKGKGEMPMYFVRKKKSDLLTDDLPREL